MSTDKVELTKVVNRCECDGRVHGFINLLAFNFVYVYFPFWTSGCQVTHMDPTLSHVRHKLIVRSLAIRHFTPSDVRVETFCS
jgi:hypothetical protein